MVLVLLSSIATIFLLTEIVIKISFPQTIVIPTIKYHGHNNLTLPHMTFCNSNLVRKSYAEENPIMRRLVHELDPLFWSKPLYYFDNNITLYEQIMNMSLDGVNAQHMFKDAAHQLEKMIHMMTLDHRVMNISEYFTLIYTVTGICYTLNGSKIEVKDQGLFSSLQLVLNVEQSEYYFGGNMPYNIGIWVCIVKFGNSLKC